MAISIQDIRDSGKARNFEQPIDGRELVSFVQGSYVIYRGHVQQYGHDEYVDRELKQAEWQALFCRDILNSPVEVSGDGVIVNGQPYNNSDMSLPSTTLMRMLVSLQSRLDNYYRNVEKGTADNDEISCIIWQKELVEGVIGYPVNLQKDGLVTIGF